MNEIKTLTLLELKGFYGINNFLHTRDKKAKSRFRLMGAVWIFLICMVFFYIGALVFGLCSLGLKAAVPTYLTVLTSGIILFFGIFSAGNRIFSGRGYDMLLAMPIKSRSIVISRFISLYIEDLILTLLIMLPGISVFAYLNSPSAGFYITAFASALFIPIIPLVISVLLGSFTLFISSRMKHKSLIQSALMIVVVLGCLLLSLGSESALSGLTEDAIKTFADSLNFTLGSVYPPALWLGDAMLTGNALGLFIFMAVSAAALALCVFAVNAIFKSVVGKLSGVAARHNFKFSSTKVRGLTKSLYIKELKGYFSSSIYVTNTIIGPILAVILSIAVFVMKDEPEIKSILSSPYLQFLPFILGAVFTMMTTTSVSISMEGKSIWLVKSLPIPAKNLFDSKILLGLTLILPCFAVSQILITLVTRPSPMMLFWQILIPLSVILFSLVLGITVNIKSHRFDWDKPEQVVKQSTSSALGGFAGLLISVIFAAIVFALAPYEELAKSGLCIVILTATLLLYRYNNKTSLTNL